MLWGLNYLRLPTDIILVVHPVGMIVSLYLLIKLIKHMAHNKNLSTLGKVGWIFLSLVIAPISWIFYVFMYKESFED